MAHTTKIATCCYCGARTALVLDEDRHELACASCGAPLHNMKSLPSAKARKKEKSQHPYRHGRKKYHRYDYDEHDDYGPRQKRRKKKKKLFRKLVEEAIDVIEDIID